MKNKTLAIIFLMVAILVIIFLTTGKSKPLATVNNTVELSNGERYDLSASYITKEIAGKKQTMLAYNGSIPGPTIRVTQGSEVTIIFKNNTDMPQLLHSHGVRMKNAFDGSQAVQKEMKPGEVFSYKLTFPDAGVYWYHPHAKEVYGQGLGLYGAFVVTPKDASYFPPVNQEIPVFLSDIPIKNGSITLDKNKASHTLMGHYGNVMLVNGEDKYTLTAKSGEVVRLYVINSANTRPFKFAINNLKLKLIGGDSGAHEESTFVDSVILGPSERAIVDIFVPKSGIYEMQNKTPNATTVLGTVSVSNEMVDISYEKEFNQLQKNNITTQSIEPFKKYFNKTVDKSIVLSLDMGGNSMNMQGMGQGGHMMGNNESMMSGSMMSSSPDGIEWEDTNQMMNSMSDTDSIKWYILDQETGKKNMDIDWVFKKDVPVKIKIFNDPKSMHPMQHPIHFHGQRFLVISRDGVKQTNLVWKDTTLVKSGEVVEIILDPSNLGTWMAHCHISEHLESGMMFGFKVE